MRERLNITSRAKDWRAKILANPTAAPFTIGGIAFSSVESALQGIKIANPVRRQEVFGLSGIEALRIGREITLSIQPGETRYVYWEDEVIVYNSIRHRLLLATFIREKVRQNETVQEALLSTEDLFIYHDVGPESPNTSLPEPFYIEILLGERRLLQRLRKLRLAA